MFGGARRAVSGDGMMEKRKALTTGLLFLACALSLPSILSAKAAVRIDLRYAPAQLKELQEIPSECYGFLAGNFAKPSPAAALVVAHNGTPGCDLPPSSAAPTAVTFKVISLKPIGLNLVRVDQNFGGSSSLRRYLLVSVVTRSLPAAGGDPASEKDLMNRGSLPDTVTDDYAAWRLARSWAVRL